MKKRLVISEYVSVKFKYSDILTFNQVMKGAYSTKLHHDGDMDHCGNMNNMDDCADGCDEYDMDMDFAD